ncbi:MarR family transcriptional regulator [Corynebacterium lizhenjunii]|uniref:MarR family transcriptional regulator n=1 Tax=Corynebacterium lizhenjunii TaxID=2709394 RepID=A0A7T0PBI6_9CORY|nr:MarR family transcriptional regulator [Corynebacterium lizhenjunii]QPK80206.1 MarR family transcriptional regulator [Corynebacterium lizhenjunii]
MLAVHARYRGRSTQRAQLVTQSAQALNQLPGVAGFESVGVEDIRSIVDGATELCDVVMALLADGDWAIGIGVCPPSSADAASEADLARVRDCATAALRASARPAQVYAKVASPERRNDAADIAAAFALLGFVLHKRTPEGREATALVRSGLNQNEAAAELGISKQAMSQRLQAAGWNAEMAGWRLAISLLERAANAPA